jgi:hypothetical protein
VADRDHERVTVDLQAKLSTVTRGFSRRHRFGTLLHAARQDVDAWRSGRFASPWPDRFAYQGHEDETTWRHEIILHRITTTKRSDPDAVDVARRIDPAANRATRTSASTMSTRQLLRSRGSAAA